MDAMYKFARKRRYLRLSTLDLIRALASANQRSVFRNAVLKLGKRCGESESIDTST